MMNTLVFGIEGYDDDPREVHTIPEVRRFYAAFHEAWPYWLYFCNLDTESLQMMVMCCLPTLEVVKVEGRSKVAVIYDRVELLKFISGNFAPMNLMCDRGQMFERLIYDRTKAVFKYFELPFDAPPPPG